MVAVMQENGPVLVEFYHLPIEDRAASVKAGHYVAKDVEYVRITPPGGNLIVEAEVTDTHRMRFERQYKAWLEGVEPPSDGQPLREWPPASPAIVKTMDAIGIRTVEALAACPDGILQGAGMGALTLKDKAKAWLLSASQHGVLAEELSALKVEVQQLRERNEQLAEENARLAAKPRRGRPPKDAAA